MGIPLTLVYNVGRGRSTPSIWPLKKASLNVPQIELYPELFKIQMLDWISLWEDTLFWLSSSCPRDYSSLFASSSSSSGRVSHQIQK